MEKTFNLKSYLEKTANMSYEGAQGYFLAQQRAWMNCSKCKREQGKSAGEAWQECFEEFQKGDRKMSWLANYASDEIQSVQKESAVDYSDDVIKLANSGMTIHTAVNTALQQRLAFDWPWTKKQQVPQTSPSSENIQTQTRKFTPEQLERNEKRKQAVLNQKQNNETFNILTKISELIKQDAYDSDSIRKLVSSIPNLEVKNKFIQIDNQIERIEGYFSKMVDQMSAEASKIIKTYQESQNKNFFAPPRQEMAADFATATVPQSQTAPAQPASPYKVETRAVPPNYQNKNVASTLKNTKLA